MRQICLFARVKFLEPQLNVVLKLVQALIFCTGSNIFSSCMSLFCFTISIQYNIEFNFEHYEVSKLIRVEDCV